MAPNIPRPAAPGRTSPVQPAASCPPIDKSQQNRQAPPLPELGPDAPCWLPRGSSWEALSPAIRGAVHQLLLPLWNQTVLQAADELQRSTAASLVYLTWLELCNQASASEALVPADPLLSDLPEPDRLIDRYLRLLTAKNRTCQLVARLRPAQTTGDTKNGNPQT